MVQDADGAVVTARAHDAQHLHILRADTERQNLAAFGLAVDVHAVQVEAQQVRQHSWQHLGQTIKVPVAVVKIVHHADVLDALRFQSLHDGDGVFRFAIPAPVVVESHLAAQRRGGLTDRLQACDFLFHPRFLVCLILHLDRATIAVYPQLRMHAVAFEELQRLLRLVIE